MYSGCSASTLTGAHSVDWPLSASLKVLSRPAVMAQALAVRSYTNTLRMVSQPPMASASSTMAFSGSSLPPRIW